MRKRAVLCGLVTVLLVACSKKGYSVVDNRYLSKTWAFFTYVKYEKQVAEQLINIIELDEATDLEKTYADNMDVGVTGMTALDVCDFIEGSVVNYKKLGSSIHKENNGFMSDTYSIEFYGSYLLETENNDYRLFYHYSFANGNEEEVGLKSLGVALYGEYEDSGYMYYDIPGVFICTNENKDFILDLKKKYSK